MLSIHLRPLHIKDRQLPGHWESDFIKDAANASEVGTLVERTSRLLVKFSESKLASAANMLQGFTDKLLCTCRFWRSRDGVR